MSPTISILMPFKNTGAFLDSCLRSITRQNYSSWELLAVDDQSSDNSRAVVLQWAAQDARIKVISNKGTGIIEALRTAYSLSSGCMITRMDSDDQMAAGRLQRMVAQLKSHGRGFIALGQVKYFSDRGISDGYARYERWLNGLIKTGRCFEEIYKECVIPSPCWMVHRSDLDGCDAFNPGVYPEDYDLCFRFYQRGLTCLPSDQVLHHWRDYDTRTSRTSEHYAQNYFLDLKLHYFLKLDRNASRPLALWGAGYKGKHLAKKMKESGVNFHWLCDNPKKIGKSIYGITLRHFEHLKNLNSPQSLIAVANEKAQIEIREYLFHTHGYGVKDYFFFC